MADERTELAVGSLRAFTLAEGILLLVLGVLALVFPVIASAWVTVVVALAFLVGGIVGWVNNLNRSRRLSKWHCFWRLVVSSLFVLTGAWIIQQCGSGRCLVQVAALAFAIGIVFLLEGVVTAIVSLSHRQMGGWGWGLANGIVTFILGLLILSMPGLSQLTVLGILVGISFLFSGIDLVVFSAAFHGPEAEG
jgi:uncharacterized membrane protein HdeD (DUF308 family)